MIQTGVRIVVEGRAAPKGSRNVKTTSTGHTYTYAASKFEKPWVDAVRDATREVMRHHPPILAPYEIDVEILIAPVPRPTYDWPAKHDLDKLVRAVVDGLVYGKAISDDRHIVAIRATKRYARADEAPGAIALVGQASSET